MDLLVLFREVSFYRMNFHHHNTFFKRKKSRFFNFKWFFFNDEERDTCLRNGFLQENVPYCIVIRIFFIVIIYVELNQVITCALKRKSLK